MEFLSEAGQRKYRTLVRLAPTAIVGLDFDGTLAPIVDDPEEAVIHPEAAAVLAELARVVAGVVIVTGRPVRQVLELGDLEEVGDQLEEHGKHLFVFGHYGDERWASDRRSVVGPLPPEGLADFVEGLPAVLRAAGTPEAHVEHKGLAVAVHTRRLENPTRAMDILRPELQRLATENELEVQEGKYVLEVRAGNVNKGDAVEEVAEQLRVGAFMFAGDDLGDLDAFHAVTRLQDDGVNTLLVCSSSQEESVLLEHADISVKGPQGLVEFLREFNADAARAAGLDDR